MVTFNKLFYEYLRIPRHLWARYPARLSYLGSILSEWERDAAPALVPHSRSAANSREGSAGARRERSRAGKPGRRRRGEEGPPHGRPEPQSFGLRLLPGRSTELSTGHG
ncbi:unnamed protein product [Coccothraustes coccothraustes]